MRFPRASVAFWLNRGQPFKALTLRVLLSILCSRQSYSQTPQADDHASDSISGTVLNSVTHEPIGRALVFSPDNRFAIFTDDHGHFELSFLTATPENSGALGTGVSSRPAPAQSNRPNLLWVKKPGFLEEPGSQRGAYIVPTQKEVTLSLVPEGLIVGRVKFAPL